MLFEEAQFTTWLSAEPKRAAAVLAPCDPALIEAYPVDPRVGNVRHDDAALVEPVVPAAPSPAQGRLF